MKAIENWETCGRSGQLLGHSGVLCVVCRGGVGSGVCGHKKTKKYLGQQTQFAPLTTPDILLGLLPKSAGLELGFTNYLRSRT